MIEGEKIMKDGKSRILKILIIAVVMALSLYPIAELTRVIWTISYVHYPSRLMIWIAETAIMWMLYLSMIPVMIWWNRQLQRIDSCRRDKHK